MSGMLPITQRVMPWAACTLGLLILFKTVGVSQNAIKLPFVVLSKFFEHEKYKLVITSNEFYLKIKIFIM